MDWPQISVVALGTLAGKWLLDFLKSGWGHFLEERKQRGEEQRTIRREKREQDKIEAERQREATTKLEHDRSELIRLVTKLSGCTDFVSAARVVGEIHHFFLRCPLYLNQHNRAFLVKYPVDLTDRAAYDAREDDDTTTLDELKRESMLLETTV
jgi:hypothetical protein